LRETDIFVSALNPALFLASFIWNKRHRTSWN
jgi:hypothetical protein